MAEHKAGCKGNNSKFNGLVAKESEGYSKKNG